MSGEGPIKFLVSDIDGTLVTPDKTLTQAAIEAVAGLGRAGLPFTVISSRPPRGMASVVSPLAVSLPYAAFNGGNIVGADGNLIEARRLAADVAAKALAVLTKGGIGAWVFADGDWLVLDGAGPKIERERHTVGFGPKVVASFDAVLDRVDKLVGVSEDDAALTTAEAEVRGALGGKANIERSQAYYLDITHPLANKGEAVKTLAGMIGVDLAETAVIGDMTNDIAMFKVAGFSVVMGQSPAAVKAEADVVTRANTEDGFAYAVEHFIRPRIGGGAA
jgi:Cof subfamily protein (haloacid dehalogenase superfamily)